MYVFLWGFFKNASLPWTLNTAQDALMKTGVTIIDPASNGNIHVLGHRSNSDVTGTVCCMRLGQDPTSVVVHAFSPDEHAARTASEQIRDYIKTTVSLEGDVVSNPVDD